MNKSGQVELYSDSIEINYGSSKNALQLYHHKNTEEYPLKKKTRTCYKNNVLIYTNQLQQKKY